MNLDHRFRISFFCLVLLFFYVVLILTSVQAQTTAQASQSSVFNQLQTNAAALQQRLQKQSLDNTHKTTPLSQKQAQILAQSAHLLYQQHECHLARQLQEKYLYGQANIRSQDWYQLYHYANCDNQATLASQALLLAWQQSNDTRKQDLYRQLLDYLSQIHIRDEQWLSWLISAYQELPAQAAVKQKIMDLQQLMQRHTRLKIGKTYIAGNDNSKVCFKLNLGNVWYDRDRPDPQSRQLTAFIQITPKTDKVFSWNYNALCVHGLNWSTDYQIQFARGLRIAGKTLVQDTVRVFHTPDRKAAIWFQNSRYVLLKNQSVQLPIFSVNQLQIHFQLYRVFAQNLRSQQFQQLFQRTIDNDTLEDIRQNLGEQVWSGTADIDGKRNQPQIHQVPLPAEKVQKNGVYLLLAARDKSDFDYQKGYQRLASQWLFVSDIGLSAYQTKASLRLIAHSLTDGKPLDGLSLRLYSQNNQLLALQQTNAAGVADFSATNFALKADDGNAPAQILINDPNQGFLFFPLHKNSFDLSDRGVGGRFAHPQLDAFVYSERNLYRPGDSVHLNILLRDSQACAIEGLPLTLKIFQPDGKLYQQHILQDKGQGGYAFTFHTLRSLATGRWQFEVYASTHDKALAQYEVKLAAIRPPRFVVSLSASDKTTPATQPLVTQRKFRLAADYLFGAKAKNLPLKIQISWQRNPRPFADYEDYIFGDDHLSSPDQTYLRSLNQQLKQHTNARGIADFEVHMPDNHFLQALRARIHAVVTDIDGQTQSATQYANFYHLPLYLGIKPSFTRRAPQNQPFSLSLVALNGAGQAQSRPLRWRLTRENSRQQWFFKGGKWVYDPVVVQKTIQEGGIQSNITHPVKLKLTLARGTYRLRVYEPESGIYSNYRFIVGEQVHGARELPDIVKLTLDKAQYQANESMRLDIDSPFTGYADIIVAGNQIYRHIPLRLTQTHYQIHIKRDPAWDPGAYILVSVYRATASSSKQTPTTRLPRRAVGVIWPGHALASHDLQLQLRAPAHIQPGKTLPVNVHFDHFHPNRPVNLTLALVDTGVLNLGRFTPPDPLSFYWGKRQLNTRLYDNYQRVINSLQGKRARMRQGGDMAAVAMLRKQATYRGGQPRQNIRIVSLYQEKRQLQQTDINLNIPIPEFNGELQLMAVAWDDTRVGQAQTRVKARDAVVMLPTIPRFLDVGDTANITLLLNHINAPTGAYQLRARALDDKLQIPAQEHHFQLERHTQTQQQISINAKQAGPARFAIELRGPQGFHLRKTYSLEVLQHAMAQTRTQLYEIPPGQSFVLPALDQSRFRTKTANRTLTISSGIDLGLSGYLRNLETYPYQCLEQIVSKNWPLLLARPLQQQWSITLSDFSRDRVNQAIDLILDKQLYNGSFALWPNQDGADNWVSLYAIEFLLTARQQNYAIPDILINQSLDWTQNLLHRLRPQNAREMSLLAYAHYVLALAGKNALDDLYVLQAQAFDKLPTLLAKAQIIAAFALYGAREQVDQLLNRLQWQVGIEHKDLRRDYGSPLRDIAAFAALLKQQAISHPLIGRAIRWLADFLQQEDKPQVQYLSTQEQAWLVRLASQLGGNQYPLDFVFNDKPVSGQTRWRTTLDAVALNRPQRLENHSDKPVWLQTQTRAVARHIKAQAAQIEIRKQIFDDQGNLADLKHLVKGQRLIIKISGKVNTAKAQRLMLADLLPAAFEHEYHQPKSSQMWRDFSWLGKIKQPRYQEFLDDKILTALDIPARNQEFVIAYPVRVINSGTFTLPPAYIEDMYQPYIRANTASKTITIK